MMCHRLVSSLNCYQCPSFKPPRIQVEALGMTVFLPRLSMQSNWNSIIQKKSKLTITQISHKSAVNIKSNVTKRQKNLRTTDIRPSSRKPLK